MPAAGSLPNSMHGCFMRVKVHLPIGLLSVISGILAGGILGFGAADRSVFLHLYCDLAVMSVWLLFACLQDLLNSLAHKLPASTELVL